MATVSRQIIAMGGGKISDPRQPAAIRKYLYNLTSTDDRHNSTSMDDRPKICLLPQARFGSSDFDSYIKNFKIVFEQTGFAVEIIRLGNIDFYEIQKKILSSQIIYVCGGSTLTLLAVWKAWGIDQILRQAYAKGVILVGDSAGANCWFDECVIKAWETPSIYSGLGFLPGTCCAHFDSKESFKSCYIKAISAGTLDESLNYGISDYTAAHFIDGKLIKGLVWANPGKQMPDPNNSLFLIHGSDLNEQNSQEGSTTITCQELHYTKCNSCIPVYCKQSCKVHHNEGNGVHCKTCYPKDHLDLDVIIPRTRKHPRLFKCYGEKCRVFGQNIRCKSCFGDYEISDSD